jgi:hypothetical protein
MILKRRAGVGGRAMMQSARKAVPMRFNRGGATDDAMEEEFVNRPAPTELTVERIPALVREGSGRS